MQLSVTGDPAAGTWEISVDGRSLGSLTTPVALGAPVTPGGPSSVAPAALALEFSVPEPERIDSARLVAVLLEDGDRLTLTAIRPRGAKGQDRDAIDVTLPESRHELSVFDPRLSTEYATDGSPRRFGIELWLGEDPDGEQRPWRLAGEASTGEPLRDGAMAVHAMTAHADERTGIGLYILVRA